MPPVLDRCIEQALRQVLQPEWDKSFAESSDGFRRGRSAPQAVVQAQRELGAGGCWVVDLAREQGFDRVNHNKLMRLVQ